MSTPLLVPAARWVPPGWDPAAVALPMASCADRWELLTSTARITSGIGFGHTGLAGPCHPRGFVRKCGAGRVQGAWPCPALPGSTAPVPTEQGWGPGRQDPQGWAGLPGWGHPLWLTELKSLSLQGALVWDQGAGTGLAVLKAEHGLCSLTLGLHPFIASECWGETWITEMVLAI